MSTKHTTLAQLQMLAERTKGLTDGLSARIDDLVTAGGEPNVIEGVKVNGTLLTLANKVADILIAEGSTDGTISVNNVDVAVKGLAALAFKAEVSEAELATALKNLINSKAAQADLDTLTGEGEGSISKMIDAAINKFATDVTDDGVVNSYKELIDWVATHGPEATEMAGGISDNATAIADLAKLVGELPADATATTVIGYIAEAIEALAIDSYAKAADVYTKTEIDAMAATDAEVTTMLDGVFGASTPSGD